MQLLCNDFVHNWTGDHLRAALEPKYTLLGWVRTHVQTFGRENPSVSQNINFERRRQTFIALLSAVMQSHIPGSCVGLETQSTEHTGPDTPRCLQCRSVCVQIRAGSCFCPSVAKASVCVRVFLCVGLLTSHVCERRRSANRPGSKRRCLPWASCY